MKRLFAAVLFSSRLARTHAAVALCNDPQLLCEFRLWYNCTESIRLGHVSASDGPLRDDADRCILCIPPRSGWSGPDPCPDCICDEMGCSCTAVPGTSVSSIDSLPCPASVYGREAYNVTVTPPTCPPSPESPTLAPTTGSISLAAESPSATPTLRNLPLTVAPTNDTPVDDSTSSGTLLSGNIAVCGIVALMAV